MLVVESVADIRKWRCARSGTVGLVPTMGALHDGHLALVRAARAECTAVQVSIFVNPTQFGPSEDYTRYPRDLKRDLALLEAEGVDLVWCPTAESMYPRGFETFVEVSKMSTVLEGSSRPGHFRGVATVVNKLLMVCAPTKAYFGSKDAQQCCIVQRMVADLNIPVDLRFISTVRESDGLALSSRNVYLSPEERKAATCLSRGLFAALKRWQAGERDAEALRTIVRDHVAAEPRARIEYVSLASLESLAELAVVDKPAVLSLAVYFGTTRLIDNVSLSLASA